MSEQRATFCRLTGAGPAAIAVVQIVSPDLPQLAKTLCDLDELPPVGGMRTARLLIDGGDPIDELLLSRHEADELRLHLHGSPWIVRQLCAALQRLGLAEVDRPQGASLAAEVAALLPEMPTLTGVRWLADQPRRWQAVCAAAHGQSPERVRRVLRQALSTRRWLQWLREPVRIAVVGPPNAGKSTLINALTREQACLVSDRPGTTRDWVEVQSELGGFPVTWLDTAGLRESADPLEAEGIARTQEQIAAADGVVLVVNAGDATDWAAWADVLGRMPLAVVSSQVDRGVLPPLGSIPFAWRGRWVCTSAPAGSGLGALASLIPMSLGRDLSQISVISALTEGVCSGAKSLLAGREGLSGVELAGLLGG